MTLKNIRKILLFLPIFIPLVFTPFTYQPWIFGKTILAFMAIDLAMIFYAVDIYRRKARVDLSYNKVDLGVLFLFLITALSAIFAFDSFRAIFGTMPRLLGLVTYWHLFVYYILLKNTFQHLEWDRVWFFSMLVGLLSIAIAWIGPVLKIFGTAIPGGYERLNGLVGNPIFFASYLWVLLVVMFVAIAVNAKYRKFYYLTIMLAAVTIVATGTRGAVLALVATILLGVFLAFIFGKYNKKIKVSILSIFAVMVVLIGLFYTQPAFFDRMPYAVRQSFNVSMSSLGVETRLMAWQIAWQGFLQRPLLGWGPSNYIHVMDKNYNPKFLSYGFSETVWDIPHNSFLEILVSIGSIGTLAFGFLLFFIFRQSQYFFSKKNIEGRYFIFLIAAVAGYFVQSLFTAEASNTFFYIVMLVAFVQSNHDQAKQLDFKYNKLIIYFIGLLSLFCIYWSYQSLLMANHLIKAYDAAAAVSIREFQYEGSKTLTYKLGYESEQAIYLTTFITKFSAEQWQAVDLTNLEDNLQQIFDQQNKRLGSNYWYNYWQAQVYGYIGEVKDDKYFDMAIAKLDAAGQFAPQRQQVPLLKARYLLAQNKIAEAKKILEDLISRDDAAYQPHWFYGLSLVMANDVTSGLRELERAVELGFELNQESNIEYMVSLYAETKQYAKIVPLMQKLIEIQPSNAVLYVRMGLVYAEIGGQNDRVIEYFNQALLLDPELRSELDNILKKYNIKMN